MPAKATAMSKSAARAVFSQKPDLTLRRAQLVGLGLEDFLVRDEHWVIADLIGKGMHIRTVSVSVWAKRDIDGPMLSR